MKVVKKVVLLSLMFLVVVFVVGCKQEQVPIENTQKLRYSEEYVESLEDRVAKLETECHYLRLAVNGFDKVDSYYLDDYAYASNPMWYEGGDLAIFVSIEQ